MKKIYLFITITGILSFSAFTRNAPDSNYSSSADLQDSVYISAKSDIYHGSSECRVLRKFTSTYQKVSVYDAVNKYHKRACKACE